MVESEVLVRFGPVVSGPLHLLQIIRFAIESVCALAELMLDFGQFLRSHFPNIDNTGSIEGPRQGKCPLALPQGPCNGGSDD